MFSKLGRTQEMKKVHLSRAFPDPLFGRFLDFFRLARCVLNLRHVRRDPQP
jgi:hypothetical protein